jgi:dolichyl-phosphate-mannose--protein O-mannosyl transferase
MAASKVARPAFPPGLRSAAGQLLTPSLCASPRLDNAHIAQDRLILLDAALCLFMINSLYCYIRFYKERYK